MAVIKQQQKFTGDFKEEFLKSSAAGSLMEASSLYRRNSLLPVAAPKLEFHLTQSRSYIPRRAVLYVPADDERKIQKVPSLKVDCAVLDCEDGVALNRKVRSTLLINLGMMASAVVVTLCQHCK